MKTVSETFESLLFDQNITESLYNIANYSEFSHMQIGKFYDAPVNHTVKYIAFSLKWYIVDACVLNGCNIMQF